MSEVIKLRPCPFCGNEAKLEQISKNGFQIKCKECKAKIIKKVLKLSMAWLENEIVKAWNNRFSVSCSNCINQSIYDFPCHKCTNLSEWELKK